MSSPVDVFEYLERYAQEYVAIDIKRFPRFWESFKGLFSHPKTIQIVGTNGKGSTGRFLSVMLKNLGYKVGHFTSPHIMRFNERIWIDGEEIDDEKLNLLHGELIGRIPEVKNLSYFEYATTLAYLAFADVDFAIMEAGLGGEYDATSVFDRELTLFTPIDIDHVEFLGDTIESIALTKLKCAPKSSIVGVQPHHNCVKALVSQQETLHPNKEFYSFEQLLASEEQKALERFVVDSKMAHFQLQNLFLAAAAIKHLGFAFDMKLLEESMLSGRSQRVAPNIFIDVGHNTLAAKALITNRHPQDATLIYNTMRDKEYKEILRVLKKRFTKIYILPLDNPRAVDIDELRSVAKALGYRVVEVFDIKRDNLVVFGSFFTVNAFLKIIARDGSV